MKNTFLKTTVGTFLALLMLFGCTQFFVSGQESETSDSLEERTERSQRNIVGVWRTVVTSRSCQTGLPVAPTFRGLITFNQDGTMSESSVASGQTPALRSLSHGVWKEGLGRRNYSFTYIHNRYDASGVFIGTQKVRAALELGSGIFFTDAAAISSRRNSFTTNASFEIFDASDNLIGRGCATSVGTRIE